MTAGYEAARLKGDTVVRTLRETARLIGEPEGNDGLGLIEEARLLDLRARDLETGLFKIIVLGEFKNGKSTLLNSMLGTTTLPAKAAPATAIITILVNGDRSEVAVYESGRTEPRLVPWDEFIREFQLSLQDAETLEEHGTLDRFRDIEYAQIECRHPLCANGVKLIDSPGLGEHLSRTRVATNFLKQSQAVIFVLNAARILTPDERVFIADVLGRGVLNHVFFVVNRMDQIGERDAAEIRRFVERELRPHFLDESGALDRELFDRRVFFVSARDALESRSAVPPDETRLSASGVPALECELERFLTGGEKVAAALQSTIALLGPIVAQADRRIAQEEAALDQPLAALEQRRVEAERQLRGLEGRKAEIERDILLFGEAIGQKILADLRTFVRETKETWPEDSQQLIDLDSTLSIKRIMTSYIDRQAREEMAAAIAEQVQRYVQRKFEEWAERIPTRIQSDVEKMVAEVEAELDDVQLELDEIAAVFAGLPSNHARQSSGPHLLQLALTLGDITGMADSIMEPGDWSSVIGRMVRQAVVVLLVGTFITGSFLLALVVVEAIHLGLQESEIKRRIRRELGERLHERLLEQITEKGPFITAALDVRFARFAADTTVAISQQIDATRAEQERILHRKQDEHFSADHEKRRLAGLGRRIHDLYAELTPSAGVDLSGTVTR